MHLARSVPENAQKIFSFGMENYFRIFFGYLLTRADD
jgi:hypothetical protein